MKLYWQFNTTVGDGETYFFGLSCRPDYGNYIKHSVYRTPVLS